jgi:hypothetical protein
VLIKNALVLAADTLVRPDKSVDGVLTVALWPEPTLKLELGMSWPGPYRVEPVSP